MNSHRLKAHRNSGIIAPAERDFCDAGAPRSSGCCCCESVGGLLQDCWRCVVLKVGRGRRGRSERWRRGWRCAGPLDRRGSGQVELLVARNRLCFQVSEAGLK